MAINKVMYGDQTLMDLTEDTVTADTLLEGITAHNKSGQPVEGTVVIPDLGLHVKNGLLYCRYKKEA